MTVLDFILDGLEAALALERELGVRSVVCDRAVLRAPAESGPVAVAAQTEHTASAAPCRAKGTYDFVFLHDRALTADGVTMMAKIVTAMGRTPETAPIVFTGEKPKAKVYVVLGGNALKKWYPGVAASPGQWIAASDSKDVLVTYSPTYILRFGTVTPSVQKLKREMWTSLKSVLQRVR